MNAILSLLGDYLNALSYLGDQLKHRDINPNNLAVTSLVNPTGIILDLDAATNLRYSTDHMKGTLAYLAPEIIDLKASRSQVNLVPYERSVDIWALGLNAFALYTGQPFRWAYFVRPAGARSDVFRKDLQAEFHRRLIRSEDAAEGAEERSILFLVRRMTKQNPAERVSATDALAAICAAKKNKDKNGTIVRKTPPKRPRADAEH